MFGLGAHIYRGEDLTDRENTKPAVKVVKNNTRTGYILKNLTDDSITVDEKPVDYIQAIRVEMALLDETKRKELFIINSDEIEKAYLAVDSKDAILKTAYEKLVDLYA